MKYYKKITRSRGKLSNIRETVMDMVPDIIGALPAIIATIISVIIGYFEKFVGHAVNEQKKFGTALKC
jgi:pyrroline-5-carboxylate reductase